MRDSRPRLDLVAFALLCACVVGAASHLLWVTQSNPSGSSFALLENTLTVAVGVFCTALCLYVAWRRPQERQLWLIWGFALLLYTIGDAIWFYLEIGLRLDPFPSLADAFYLAQIPLLILGILNLPKKTLRPTEGLRIALNIGVLTAAVATVMWRYAIAPVIDAGGESLPFVISLLYPLCNFVTLCVMIFHLARPHLKTMLTQTLLLAVAVALIACADVTFSLIKAQKTTESAAPFYSFWLFANVFIATAAFVSLHHRDSPEPISTATFETKSPPFLFLFAPFLAILIVVAIPIFDAQPTALERLGSQIGTLLVIALVMARQVAAFADNDRLNRDLKSLSASLERRVLDRTQQLVQREQRERQRSVLLERIVHGEDTDALEPALLEFSRDDPDGASVLTTLSTERSALMERLEWNATRDPLTGLLNRRSLQVWLERCLLQHACVVVYVIDLDGFKRINDTLGHNAGDLLLRSVTLRFQQVLPSSALLSRTGGDEFVIALPLKDLDGDALGFATRILQSLEQPFKLLSGEFSINASIGFSLYPQHSLDSESLQRQADAAMYTAKSRGRGQIEGFSAEINAQIERRLEVENQLRLALVSDQLELHYQPIVNIHSGAILALEALLRWNSPVLGWMLPDQFIPIAEKSGLIASLSDWVLNRACAQNAAWQHAGLSPVRIAVNLSALQLEQPELPRLVELALQRSGLAATWLELELVETVLASTQAARPLHDLRALGVHLSVDDFGTGYSSLSYLHRLPIDALKIPQTFTSVLHNDQDRGIQPVLEAIIAIARSLGLNVTAEGIETPEQLELLRALGCDAAQGYLFARPAPASVATRWLEIGMLKPTAPGLERLTIVEQ